MSTIRLSPKVIEKKIGPTVAILADNFGFTVNGALRMWKAGQTVRDRAEIDLLVAQGAPLEDIQS